MEYTISRMKKFRIMADEFRNRLKRYGAMTDIVSGLVNFRIMGAHEPVEHQRSQRNQERRTADDQGRLFCRGCLPGGDQPLVGGDDYFTYKNRAEASVPEVVRTCRQGVSHGASL